LPTIRLKIQNMALKSVVFLSCLACVASLRMPEIPKEAPKEKLDMLIAVFTAPAYSDRRASVRETWKVPKNVKVNFILCETGNATLDIWKEEKMYGDIMRVPCVEGYKEGKLTKKTIATMRAFHDKFPEVPFLFKTDDDTYPQIDKLLASVKSEDAKYLIAGQKTSGGKVHRENKNAFYEPKEIYKLEKYPPSVAGGPGYVLSKSLVTYLLEQGIEAKVVPSYNEDKAIGIWVQQFPELTENVHWKDIHSINGYGHSTCEYMKNLKTWKNYEVVLHHNLSPAHMKCMSAQHEPESSDFACFCEKK